MYETLLYEYSLFYLENRVHLYWFIAVNQMWLDRCGPLYSRDSNFD